MIAAMQIDQSDPLAGLGYSLADAADFGISCDPDEALKSRYLEEYRKIGQECSAAYHSGVGVRIVNRWKRDDPAFAERMELQYQLHVEDVIREAYRRAIVGEPRLKFYKGEPISILNKETDEYEPYIEYEKSDKLLIELLAVLDDRFQKRGASAGTTVNVNNTNALALGVVENPAFYGNQAHELLEGE